MPKLTFNFCSTSSISSPDNDPSLPVSLVWEIAKIEDFNLPLESLSEITEIDERLYTYEKAMSFDDFKKIYYHGMFSD